MAPTENSKFDSHHAIFFIILILLKQSFLSVSIFMPNVGVTLIFCAAGKEVCDNIWIDINCVKIYFVCVQSWNTAKNECARHFPLDRRIEEEQQEISYRELK